MIGDAAIPENFKYMEVFLKGRPEHDKLDAFRIRHPSMPSGHRAKIFAPFDALYGFDERVKAKTVLYEEKRRLSEGEVDELNQKFCHLHSLTANGRLARQNKPTVTITYFSPCADPENDWYGCGGQYLTVNGTVLRVEMDAIRIKTNTEERIISFSDIRDID